MLLPPSPISPQDALSALSTGASYLLRPDVLLSELAQAALIAVDSLSWFAKSPLSAASYMMNPTAPYDWADRTSGLFSRFPAVYWTAHLLYVPLVFGLQAFMRNRSPLSLRVPLILWNAALALFSIAGTVALLPTTRRALAGELDFCGQWPQQQPNGIWMHFFIVSKIFEFVDTIFLVLRKRPVIFLHWFHHIATAAYCWYSAIYNWQTSIAVVCFCLMNYFVHSIMYSYYALQAARVGGFLRALHIDMIITTLQLAQMLAGTYFSARAALQCNVDALSAALSGSMYLCYLFLFAQLFVGKYCRSKRATGGGADKVRTKDE